MKNASKYAKKLSILLRQLKAKVKDMEMPEKVDPIETIVRAFLISETGRHQANQAYVRLMRYVVDFNDLRVTNTEELVSVLGDRYSRLEERVIRLRRGLEDIYEKGDWGAGGRPGGMYKRYV